MAASHRPAQSGAQSWLEMAAVGWEKGAVLALTFSKGRKINLPLAQGVQEAQQASCPSVPALREQHAVTAGPASCLSDQAEVLGA